MISYQREKLLEVNGNEKGRKKNGKKMCGGDRGREKRWSEGEREDRHARGWECSHPLVRYGQP